MERRCVAGQRPRPRRRLDACGDDADAVERLVAHGVQHHRRDNQRGPLSLTPERVMELTGIAAWAVSVKAH